MTDSEILQSKRLAERLKILTITAKGILTRVHYLLKSTRTENDSIQQIIGNDSPLAVLTKSLSKGKIKEADLINVLNAGSVNKEISLIKTYKEKIVKILESPYNTLIEILEFRSQFCDLIADMEKYRICLKIHVNFHGTYHYLKLVTLYAKILMLLRRINDRRIIATLYHYAASFIEQSIDVSMSKRSHHDTQYYSSIIKIIDMYENPIKQLINDFNTNGAEQLDSAYLSIYESKLFKTKVLDEPIVWEDQARLSLLPRGGSENSMVTMLDDDFKHPWLLVGEAEITEWIFFGYLIRVMSNIDSRMFQHVLKSNFIIKLIEKKLVEFLSDKPIQYF